MDEVRVIPMEIHSWNRGWNTATYVRYPADSAGFFNLDDMYGLSPEDALSLGEWLVEMAGADPASRTVPHAASDPVETVSSPELEG